MLCARGAQLLQTKSINVEEAANELINMLCENVTQEGEEEEEGEDHDMEEQEDEEGGKLLNTMVVFSYLIIVAFLSQMFIRLRVYSEANFFFCRWEKPTRNQSPCHQQGWIPTK